MWVPLFMQGQRERCHRNHRAFALLSVSLFQKSGNRRRIFPEGDNYTLFFYKFVKPGGGDEH